MYGAKKLTMQMNYNVKVRDTYEFIDIGACDKIIYRSDSVE